MVLICSLGRLPDSANWIANWYRLREYRMSSFVDMSFSVNSLIFLLDLICNGNTSPSVVIRYRLPQDENTSFTPPVTEPE